jgi:hypothetical protein
MAANLFDANFYRAANADLARLDNNQITAHFFTYGLDEGRLFSPLVNLNLYRASNSDLSSFNNRQLYNHLSNHGVAEGRKFSPFFDSNYYRYRNGDLAQFNNEQLFWHAQNYGVAEGRRTSEFMDINFYKGVNGDLASLSNAQALAHLIVYGVNEGRRFSEFVDLNVYRAANPDLTIVGFDNNQLLNHLRSYGVNEGRRFSAAFDTNYYRGLYSDLRQAGLNNTQLFEHFQDFGVREGRVSSESFNVTYYLANNADLRQLSFTNQQALQHFEIFGLREGRLGAATNSISLVANRDDNTLGVAANLGVLNGSRNFSNQFVGSNDREDYYRFTVAQTSNVNISVTGVTNDVTLELIYDLNGDGVYDELTELLYYSDNLGNNSNEIINQPLAAGTYFVRVYPNPSTGNTNYNIGLSATPNLPTTPRDPGNTLREALDIGTLTGSRSLRDFVGVADMSDYYRFNLASNRNFNLNLTGLTDDADVELIQDINNNGEVEFNEVLSLSNNLDASNETITVNLGAGTYYINVYNFFNSNTNYTLNLVA